MCNIGTTITCNLCSLMLVSTRSDLKHTSVSRKILAQVQEASKRMAAELDAKYPNSKVHVHVVLL